MESSALKPDQSGPAVYTVNELAEALRVSPITVRRAIDRGDVRTVRAGARVRIPAREFHRLTGTGTA